MHRWAERDREDLAMAAASERHGDHRHADAIRSAAEHRQRTRHTRIPYPVTADGTARRPWRAPHHTVSVAGLVGGGNPVRPGEASLSHGGILFLDELPEFSRAAIDCMRWALDDRRIDLVRARYQATLPAAFSLVAGLDPCPCGFSCHAPPDDTPRRPDSPPPSRVVRGCVCSDGSIGRWWERARPIVARPDVVTLVYGCDLAALPVDLWGRAVVVREPAAFAAASGSGVA
jgi:hypothetical protein